MYQSTICNPACSQYYYVQQYLHMVYRRHWIERIEQAWKRKNVVWLSGVRRAGKTFLCRSLEDVHYFDCELPRTRRLMADPEFFLENHKDLRIVLDEIHRLPDPTELLKIAADYYPSTKVLATGSSTLGASTRLRDNLAGRKEDVWLTPMALDDMGYFSNPSLGHRFLRGGLPPFFMAETLPEREYQDWFDAFWAKDILELFRLERRHSFLRFSELLLAQSGGMYEATRFAAPCEVSRTTISNYLSVLESTYVMHIVRPFSSRKATEIVSAPKVYAFDTGFVCAFKGWEKLRDDDMGLLWEHFVLNELQAALPTANRRPNIRYWRDKGGYEIDFVISGKADRTTVIDCKWSSAAFEPAAILAFRRRYPLGHNYVVAADADNSYTRAYRGVDVQFISLRQLSMTLIAEL